ncbi:uncharacterized protein F4807DRAFT_457356 [Annulohypoxylon truncatum]|uniref:uncharacterized protein n=1 Tax=Annulohypoxylon truncatum TaxID=327061 RepID=UPI00200780B8|nr:uncharacterized protein F4807DRAFT_457356 [Annulohypoxylon truncatum]KAI1212560.1 hypothetical protein F4807DRAFT_457356 [Annulohypoxylon truncatum]
MPANGSPKIVRTELTVPEQQEQFHSAPAFGMPNSGRPGNIYDGQMHAVDTKLTELGDPVVSMQQSSGNVSYDSESSSMIVQVSEASASTDSAEQTAQEQYTRQNNVPALSVSVPPYGNQNEVPAYPTQTVPFYMQPNVGTTRYSIPPHKDRPYWQQADSQWDQPAYGPYRQHTVPAYWNQYPEQGAPQPPMGPPPAPAPDQDHTRHRSSKSRSCSKSSVTWLPAGEDPLHGPTKVFRKQNGSERSSSPTKEYDPTVDKPLALGCTNKSTSKDRRPSNGRSSNASMSRRPSFTSSLTGSLQPVFASHQVQNGPPHAQDPSRFKANNGNGSKGTKYGTLLNGICRNERQFNSAFPKRQKYKPCSCARCVDRDNAIYVDGFDGYVEEETARKVVEYFEKKIGPTKRYWTAKGAHGVVIIFEDEQSAHNSVRGHHFIPGISSRPLHVGYRVGSQYFKPVPPRPRKAEPQKHDTQRSNYGPTHPNYPQASSTIAGLATLGVRVDPSVPYRAHSFAPSSFEGVTWAIPPYYGPSSHRAREGQMAPFRIPVENPSRDGKQDESDKQGAKVDKGKAKAGEALTDASRQSSEPYFTPREHLSPKEEDPAREPEPVVARSVEADDNGDEPYDYGTMIVRRGRPNARLPQSWADEPPRPPATPPLQVTVEETKVSTPKTKLDKGKGKATVNGDQDDEGPSSQAALQPWASVTSSRSRGSRRSSSRPTTMTPSPPLSVNSPPTPSHLHPAVTEEWLAQVNDVLVRLNLRRLNNYDVLLVLRGRPRADHLLFQRGFQVLGTEDQRRSFLRQLQRALRGVPNNIIDYSLRGDEPHPISEVRRWKRRQQEEALMEEQKDGGTGNETRSRQQNLSPTPAPRRAQSLNPAAPSFMSSVTSSTGIAAKDASQPDGKAEVQNDKRNFTTAAASSGKNWNKTKHAKKSSQNELEKAKFKLTGIPPTSQGGFSSVQGPGQGKQFGRGKGKALPSHLRQPSAGSSNKPGRKGRPFKGQHMKTGSGATATSASASGTSTPNAAKALSPTMQAAKPVEGQTGGQAKEQDDGKKEKDKQSSEQTGGQVGGQTGGQAAAVPTILTENDWPSLSPAATPRHEHRPASAAWANDPLSFANRAARMASSRGGQSGSPRTPTQASSDVRSTGQFSARKGGGHKDQNKGTGHKDQSKRGGKKG